MSTEAVVVWAGLSARERDAMVAEKVMGERWRQAHHLAYPVIGPHDGTGATSEDVIPGPRIVLSPRYTTDIAAAWLVVEKLRERWAAEPNAKHGEPDAWRFADLSDEGWEVATVWMHHDGDIVEHVAKADSLPEAICLAALEYTLNNIHDSAVQDHP